MPKTDPLEELTCNREADQVHIRWDFGGAWEAIILEGPNRGHKVKCVVSDFDQEKWLSVGADARYGTDFRRTSTEQKKEASWFSWSAA